MNVQRTFIPGQQWLYYKIYCGARTADTILTQSIKPLTAHLAQNKWVDQWFFIRYHDPDTHIRIRFYIPDLQDIGIVMQKFAATMQPHIANDMIHKIQIDTYQREIERYGATTITTSETLFYHECTMLLEAIDMIEDEEVFFMFILKTIDQLLGSFGYEIEEKLKLVERNRDHFKAEFYADKTLTKQLDQKYRKNKEQLSNFLIGSYPDESYKVLDTLLDHKKSQSQIYIDTILELHKQGQLQLQRDHLLGSYIHMLVNRAFRSRQRFYELVVYDFLSRKYKSDRIRNTVSIPQ